MMLENEEVTVAGEERMSLETRVCWKLAYLDFVYARDYKRVVSIALLSLQYLLAILSVILEDVEPVVYAYGANSALNGFLLSTQRFYFQIEPLVLNEVFFDSLFLIKLLFFTNLAGGDPEAQTFLYTALGFAFISFVGFAAAYWLVFPKVVSWRRLTFEPRTGKRFVRLEAFLHIVSFTLTDSADVIILMTQVLLLNVLVDAKIVLFVIFLLLNPLMSQLGKFTTVRKDEKEDLVLPPKDPEEYIGDYEKRELEFQQKLRAIKNAEEQANGKNVALTGLMSNLVLPVLFTAAGLLANPNTPEWQVAIWCMPVYTALPLWMLWEIFGIPWDRYFLFNDVWRAVVTRVIVVCWGILIVILDALSRPEAIVISLALLLYALLPVSILLGEAYLRRTRLECNYRSFKPFEDMGTPLLFRSKLADSVRYTYSPPSAIGNYYAVREAFGLSGESVPKRFDKALDRVEELLDRQRQTNDLESYVIAIQALFTMYAKCYKRGIGGVLGSDLVAVDEFAEQLKRIDEIEKDLPNAFDTLKVDTEGDDKLRAMKLKAREAWYVWCEVHAHTMVKWEYKNQLQESLMETPEMQIAGIEPFGAFRDTFGQQDDREEETEEPLLFTVEQLQLIIEKNKALAGFSLLNYPRQPEVWQHVNWGLAKRMSALDYQGLRLTDDNLGEAIMQNLPPRLKYLSAKTCEFGPKAAAALGVYIARRGCIMTEAELSSNYPLEGTGALFRGLGKNKSIRTMNFSKSRLAPSPEFEDAFKTNRSLRRLNLRGCHTLKEAGVESIARGLAFNVGLVVLDLQSVTAHAKGAIAIAKALESNHTLEELDITSNRIENEGGTAFGQALAVNVALKKLVLNDNVFDAEPLVAIAEGIGANPRSALQELFVSGCNCEVTGPSGIPAFATLLRTNKTLVHLDLSWNQAKLEGAQAIADALQVNTTLKILRFSENEVGDDGLRVLAQGVAGNKGLELARLVHNLYPVSQEAKDDALAADPRIRLDYKH